MKRATARACTVKNAKRKQLSAKKSERKPIMALLQGHIQGQEKDQRQGTPSSKQRSSKHSEQPFVGRGTSEQRTSAAAPKRKSRSMAHRNKTRPQPFPPRCHVVVEHGDLLLLRVLHIQAPIVPRIPAIAIAFYFFAVDRHG